MLRHGSNHKLVHAEGMDQCASWFMLRHMHVPSAHTDKCFERLCKRHMEHMVCCLELAAKSPHSPLPL